MLTLPIFFIDFIIGPDQRHIVSEELLQSSQISVLNACGRTDNRVLHRPGWQNIFAWNPQTFLLFATSRLHHHARAPEKGANPESARSHFHVRYPRGRSAQQFCFCARNGEFFRSCSVAVNWQPPSPSLIDRFESKEHTFIVYAGGWASMHVLRTCTFDNMVYIYQMYTLLLPWPKKSLQPRIHEIDPQCDHVISCDINFDLQRELATHSCHRCRSHRCWTERSEARYRTISHDRAVDQPHEFLGCNDFFGQDTVIHFYFGSVQFSVKRKFAVSVRRKFR